MLFCIVTITWLATSKINSPIILSVNDKLSHIAAFYALALMVDFAFPKYTFNWQKFLMLFLYGLLLEIVQHNLPYRHFSLLDLAADAIGMLAYIVSIPLLKNLPILKLRWI